MMAMGLCAAASYEEVQSLGSSRELALARLRTGRLGKPPPSGDLCEMPMQMRREVDLALSCPAAGSPRSVQDQI